MSSSLCRIFRNRRSRRSPRIWTRASSSCTRSTIAIRRRCKKGGVLLVGGGNSGAEIAMELVKTHDVWLSGRDTGHVPFRIDGLLARLFMYKLILRFLFHRVFTIRTPMGRKARPKAITQGGPLIRVKPKDLQRVGVVRVPKTVGAKDGLPLLEDGRVLNVTNVIWCTGFQRRLLLDPPSDSRAGRADARARDRPARARAVLRGPGVSLFVFFGDDPRRRAGCRPDRGRHRGACPGSVGRRLNHREHHRTLVPSVASAPRGSRRRPRGPGSP